MASIKRNTHGWTRRTEDGRKREVRARLFGRRWTFQARIQGEEAWTELEEVGLDDLYELLHVMENKYRRKHLAWDHLTQVQDMITARGGSLD